MRGEINSKRYVISFRLKISLRFSVISVLAFKWIEAKWNSKRYGFHIGHFDRNEISFRVIKCHVNYPTLTTLNVHQNIGSFWNADEMKLRVNRICFHAGWKSQSGMSSFHLSCERTLTLKNNHSFFFRKFFSKEKWNFFFLTRKQKVVWLEFDTH